MRIALTGATGFVGRHVVAELERRSISPALVVRSADRVSQLLRKHPIVEMDLHHPPKDAFALLGHPDVLIHLAWGGLPNYSSLHHLEQELPSQYGFLKLLVESGLHGLVVAGTCLEYGMQYGPLGEDLHTIPQTPYGFAKDTLRRQLEYLQGERPFHLTWARLFYLYGEGQSEKSLLPQLEKAISCGERVFNMSGGEQLRDYLPATEVARYLVSVALPVRDNGVVNVCSGQPISVRRLVESWIQERGALIDLNLGYYAYPQYEPMAFWGDRRKLERCLESE